MTEASCDASWGLVSLSGVTDLHDLAIWFFKNMYAHVNISLVE